MVPRRHENDGDGVNGHGREPSNGCPWFVSLLLLAFVLFGTTDNGHKIFYCGARKARHQLLGVWNNV